MLLPTRQRNDDPVVVVVLVAIASWAIGLLIGAIANGDEFRPRRRPRLSLEEPEPVPRKRPPAATPKSAARSEGSAIAPRKDGVPADPRPLVIVYTVPLQCAPCREFDRWAEKHAGESPFRFQAREYRKFTDLPARIGTVPQFEFDGADGKRHRLNGWHDDNLMPLVAEYMRHNPEWKPITRTKRGAK